MPNILANSRLFIIIAPEAIVRSVLAEILRKHYEDAITVGLLR